MRECGMESGSKSGRESGSESGSKCGCVGDLTTILFVVRTEYLEQPVGATKEEELCI